MYRKCVNVAKAILPQAVYGGIREGILKGVGWCVFVVKLAMFPFAWLYMWWLNRKQPTKITTMIAVRIGHLALNTDLLIRTGGIKNQRIIFIAPKPIANDFLLKRWGDMIEVIDYDTSPFLSRFLDTLPLFLHTDAYYGHSVFYAKFLDILPFKLQTKYAFELPYGGNEYDIYHSTKGMFYFTDSEKQEGDRILEEMGVGKQDWYVCVFARDSAYLDKCFGGIDANGDRTSVWLHNDYRDSDIDSLNLAIDEIISRGGYVVRLGKIVAKAMSYTHERVIDYPLSKWRSDFMDIYLQYRAKFVLSSSTSGATDVVALFGTPYCGVNMPTLWNVPYPHAIQIPKTYRHKESGKMVGLKEWIEMVKTQRADHRYGCDYNDPSQLSIWHTGFYAKNNLEIINNTPEEILELTKEMFARLDGSFSPSEEDKALQEKYQALNATYLPCSECKNPYGADFLRKNQWFVEGE